MSCCWCQWKFLLLVPVEMIRTKVSQDRLLGCKSSTDPTGTRVQMALSAVCNRAKVRVSMQLSISLLHTHHVCHKCIMHVNPNFSPSPTCISTEKKQLHEGSPAASPEPARFWGLAPWSSPSCSRWKGRKSEPWASSRCWCDLPGALDAGGALPAKLGGGRSYERRCQSETLVNHHIRLIN